MIARGFGHGKIILFGEHAVVHGTLAVAAALPFGITAVATHGDGPLALEVPAWRYGVTLGDGSLGATALASLADALGVSHTGVRLTAQPQLPARSGLGSSAALGAAMARALSTFEKEHPSEQALFTAVQAFETVFHGNPSGLDASLALGGGVRSYSRAAGAQTLSFELPRLLVVNTGEPGDTKVTVARFAAKLAAEPHEGGARLHRIGQIAADGLLALEAGDRAALGALMDENQALLAWFGVSSPTLDRICALARERGALGAKLTGGGGGGAAIVLPTEATDSALAATMQDAGFEVFAL